MASEEVELSSRKVSSELVRVEQEKVMTLLNVNLEVEPKCRAELGQIGCATILISKVIALSILHFFSPNICNWPMAQIHKVEVLL